MSATTFISFQNSQIGEGLHSARNDPNAIRRAVTISRQAGCGAQEIATKLAIRMQAHSPDNCCPWSVFDRDLIDRVLEDHHLPKYLAAYLPEDRKPVMEDMLEDIFGLHPPESTIVKQTAETILGLAEVGKVILIGRGGNIVTSRLPHVLHVRLVAPLENRIEHAEHACGLSRTEARNFCLREDLGRERYVHKHFHANVDNPLLYHLVINTALMSSDAAAQLMEESLLSLQAPKPAGITAEKTCESFENRQNLRG